MLIPMACANRDCVSPTNRRRAATSSPVSKTPAASRFRTRAEIVRAKSLVVSSGMSLIGFLGGGEEELAFLLGGPARADDPDCVVVLLGVNEDQSSLDGANGEEAFFLSGV